MLRLAYELGVQLAYKNAGLTKNADSDSKAGLPWWAPLAVGAGTGLGAYGLARFPLLANRAKFPVLRKIQEMAKGKMLRTGLPGSENVNPSLWERFKRSVMYGPEILGESIPKSVRGTARAPTAVYPGYNTNLPVGVFDPATIGAGAGHSQAAGRAVTRRAVHLSDKFHQARLLQKYAPGTMANTLSVQDIMKKYNLKLRRGKYLKQDLQQLQAALQKEFGGKRYLIKPRAERPGGPQVAQSPLSAFPTEKDDLFTAWKDWQKIKKPFKREFNGSSPDAAMDALIKYRTDPGYKGLAVEELLHKNVIFQERVKALKFPPHVTKELEAAGHPSHREYRIHAIGGKAVPSLSLPRARAGLLRTSAEYLKARQANAWFQQEVLDKLPERFRNLSMGADVVGTKGGGFKVMELNPQGGGDTGLSGFMDFPFLAPQWHRAVTGVSTPANAALAGLASAGAGAGLASAVLPGEKK